MSKTTLAILIGAALLFSAPAFAIDGQVLINQATVLAAGGFPYQIHQPGSYKLSGNLAVPAGVDGVDIYVSNVTIDLNGFTISGPVTCTGGGSGISCGTDPNTHGIHSVVNNATVRNGSVVGFSIGVALLGASNLVEEIHASSNFTGIFADEAIVRRNTSSYNGVTGIVGGDITVTENIADENGTYGLQISTGVYGNNIFEGNPVPVLAGGSGAVSQKNNECNGTAC